MKRENQKFSDNVRTDVLKISVLDAVSKEELSARFQMSWREFIELMDEKELLRDRDVTVKLLSLQSEKVF